MVVLRDDLRSLRVENRLHFVQRPSEIIAVVIQAVVGVLAPIEAAFGARKHRLNKRQDAQRNLAEEFAPRYLIGAKIVHEQAGVVIGHFLEVGNNPALIH